MNSLALSGALSFDRLLIADCLVDPASLTIQNADIQISVEPKVMVLLQVLTDMPHVTWHRETLLDRIWPNGEGGDESLTRLVYLLRKAFSDVGVKDKIIKTVARRGYKLERDVIFEIVNDNQRDANNMLPFNQSTMNAVPHPPFSVAVMPFTGLIESHHDGLLREGMTRDLTALLSRTPRLYVAPVSSAHFTSHVHKGFVEQARSLKVRYLVSGSLTVPLNPLVI